MNAYPDPREFPWNEVEDVSLFRKPEWTNRLLDGLSVWTPGTRGVDLDLQRVISDLLRQHSTFPLKRLKLFETELRKRFISKGELIRMLIVSSIAEQPMLLIGLQGTAKSRLITRYCEGLGVGRIGDQNPEHTCFQYLLHNFTEPDELLGLLDLVAFRKERKFRRIREGSITDAAVIFLDEVFKANSAILNALLTIINERRVYEGGQAWPAKARLIFGASNAPPTRRQLEDLRAFYERFIIRVESAYVPLEFRPGGPSAEREQLLRQGWKGEVDELRGGFDPAKSAIEPVSCLNDILLCNRAMTELWGGENLDDPEYPEIRKCLRHYHSLVAQLGGGDQPQALIDDRKFVKLYLVVRAFALFDHNGPPNVRDMCVLKHVWDDLSGKELVAQTVNHFIQNALQENQPAGV